MTYKEIRVPMPSKWVLQKKRANNKTYVYYITRAYRNKQGKATSDQVAIGRFDEVTGDLIPNSRYFDFFPENKPVDFEIIPKQKVSKSPRKFLSIEQLSDLKIKSYGVATVMFSIAEQIGLLKILQKCFPDKWDSLLAVAFYMISQGNTMMYISDWFEETLVNFTEPLTDIDCSKLFASLTATERHRFFTEWIRFRGEQEYISYDITSISTYSKSISHAEYGYNRDGEKLPQLNFGMFYGFPSHTPVYYDLYNGSIPDKTCLKYMMSNASEFGIRDVCMVFDRGFVTDENLTYLLENKYSFITAMPSERVAVTNLIDEVKGKVEKVANWIEGQDIYAVKQPYLFADKTLTAHIYYNPEKKALDTLEIYTHIPKLRAELEKMSKAKHLSKRFTDYYIVEKQSSNTISFKLDENKIDERLSRAGYFVLVSSNPNLSSKEVLKTYRERDIIEKNFDQLKNGLDFRRMKTHWDKTTEGKMFVGFIALIIRSYMLHTLKSDENTKGFPFDKIMIELKKMKSTQLSDSKIVYFTLTKTQKKILFALKVSCQL